MSIKNEDFVQIVNCFSNWDKLEGASILVTGANGFLPAYMVETILFLNDHVFNKQVKLILLVRNIKNAKLRFGDILERSDVFVIEQDVSKPINVRFDIDYIVHAASFASPKYYDSVPVDVLAPNIIGTYNLLELSRQRNVKSFLFFSSAEVYGIGINDPITENDGVFINQLNTRSCYSESKRMGEQMCVAYMKQYGVPVKIVRPFHTYGPGMKLNDGRVFADFISNVLNKQDIHLMSSGTALRSFCYLSDATTAFFLVLLNGVNGEAYNVGNPDCESSIIELAKLLAKIYSSYGISLSHRAYSSLETIDRVCPNIEKISNLGWKPEVGLADGFMRTINSFNEVR